MNPILATECGSTEETLATRFDAAFVRPECRGARA